MTPSVSEIEMNDKKCYLCPRKCGTIRSENKGVCGEKNVARIAKYYLHPFEEPVISGTKGSGTVFFCGCSLKCRFCQNFELSRSERGKPVTARELSDIFKELENSGAHNINLVTPTHFLPEIAEAVKIRRPNVPIVYNTHGYELKKNLEIANEFVDVYLPDLKFFTPAASMRYTGVKDYFEVASAAIGFMMQSKKTVIENELMVSGVCVRHLILPMNLPETFGIIDWFDRNRENGAYFSLMAQYTPFGDIEGYPELKRPVTAREYRIACDKLLSCGFGECFIQERSSSGEKFIPKWDF